MRWTIQIARLADTQVKVHWSLVLFLAWIGYLYGRSGGWPAALVGMVFIGLIFLCVLLHEFGHAFAARHFGIRTPEITLLPIGGVARLERIPEEPAREILVAAAGPAVNLGLAALLWAYILLTGGFPAAAAPGAFSGVNLPVKLLSVNLWLVLFNLIPAFPMDGGRILRAMLAMRTDYSRATTLAAHTGQFIALLFGLFGLAGNPMLLFIAALVYFGAAGEASVVRLKAATRGLRVASAMVTDFHTLPLKATLQEAVEVLLRTSHHEFPVVDELGKFYGLLTRDDLIAALRHSGPQSPIAGVVRLGVAPVHFTMPFEDACARMQQDSSPALPVLDSGGQLVGLFTTENAGELVMVREAISSTSGSLLAEGPGPQKKWG